MNTTKLAALTVVLSAAAAIVGITACGSTVDHPDALPSPPPGASSSTDSWVQGQIDNASKDPLQTDGTWVVPTQIKPGTYMAVQDPDANAHYWEVCRSLDCGNFNMDNVISNGNVEGAQDYIVVPPEAKAVALDGVNLVPVP